METHAHHLHKSPGHGWKHYFFEFFMLFLAVTLGFIVENLREQYVERKRGQEYVRSLYEDLKTDTTRLSLIIRSDAIKIAALNGMSSCYDTVMKNLLSTSCMGELVKYSKTNASFAMTDRTTRQLANAGGFRILNKEDADSILSYENAFKIYQDFQATLFQTAQDNVRNTLNQMASFKVNAPIQSFAVALGPDTSSSRLSGPLLFTDDKVLLNKWFNELALYLRVTIGQQAILGRLYRKTSSLIEFYKNKYHLE